MDLTNEISQIRKDIARLGRIRDQLCKLEDEVYAIEKKINDIDAALPPNEEISMMGEGFAKEQILCFLDLAEKAYGIVDEILGPPDENSIAFEDALMEYSRASKNKAS